MTHRVRIALVCLLALGLVSACARARAGWATPTPSAPTERPTRPAPPSTPRPTPTTTPTAVPSPAPTPTPDGPLVLVDPGHGGEDLGACHVDERGRLVVTESEINLAIALKLRDELQARGVRVLMTREEDVYLNDPPVDVNGNGEVDYRDELQARVDLANDAGAELILSIHQNAYYYGPGVLARDVGGTMTYYCAARPFAEESLRLAHLVQDAVVEALASVGYQAHDRGVRVDAELNEPGEEPSYLILLGPETPRIVRPSQMPGALSETLFITHDEEVRLLQDPEVQAAVARAYADAVVAYLATRPAATEGGR